MLNNYSVKCLVREDRGRKTHSNMSKDCFSCKYLQA